MAYWERKPPSFRERHPELYRQEPSTETFNRTYKLTAELIERLNATAAGLKVYPSDLVRFLLATGLDQVDAGDLEIPTMPAHRHIIFEGDQ